MKFTPEINIQQIYERFSAPVTAVDCGQMCAPHNPNGKPFCCDICEAVPAAYCQEWHYLRERTDLWHVWRGDECAANSQDPSELLSETPNHMLLLACRGPERCQREFRALSCRQFPFYPYVSSDYRFLGLSYVWQFEAVCWVISNLELVSAVYRRGFVAVYDEIFAQWQEDFDSYAVYSEQARGYFAESKRRLPLLHRNGGFYLVSPGSERMQRVSPQRLRRFGPYCRA